MNLFGAINFGRLIKTFLPGFIMFCSLYLIIDGYLLSIDQSYKPFTTLTGNGQLIGVISIPVSLIFGTFSNILFFSGITTLFIKIPFKYFYKSYTQLESKFKEELLKKIGENGEMNYAYLRSNESILDHENLIMPKLDLEKYLFLQESYWYYLEFIQNMIFSLIIFIISTSYFVNQCHNPEWKIILISENYFLMTAFVLLFCTLIYSAFRNYRKFMFKLLSLKIGTLKLMDIQ